MTAGLPTTPNHSDAEPGQRAPGRILRRACLLAMGALCLGGCAAWPGGDPLRVDLVGIDPLPGEGLELRFALRLRVQNPNDRDIQYDGVSLELDLRGQRFASGVAALSGQVPRFGETVLTLPVSVSGFSLARQLFGLARETRRIERVTYSLRGKLASPLLGSMRFDSSGQIELGSAAL